MADDIGVEVDEDMMFEGDRLGSVDWDLVVMMRPSKYWCL